MSKFTKCSSLAWFCEETLYGGQYRRVYQVRGLSRTDRSDLPNFGLGLTLIAANCAEFPRSKQRAKSGNYFIEKRLGKPAAPFLYSIKIIGLVQ